MFFVRETSPNTFETVTADYVIGEGENALQVPFGNLLLWTREECLAHDVTPIEEPVPPEGYHTVSITFSRNEAGEIVANPTFAKTVPSSITKRQFYLQAKAENLWWPFQSAINADEDTKNIFEFTSVIERHDPLVEGLAAALSKTSDEVDDFFIAASVL